MLVASQNMLADMKDECLGRPIVSCNRQDGSAARFPVASIYRGSDPVYANADERLNHIVAWLFASLEPD
jgi:hypothetical protein